MIFFGGVYLFFYFLFGDFLIKLLYGRDYNSAYYVGFFIVITTILSNLGQLYSRVMFYYNDFKYLMYKTFVCTLLGLAFGIVLIKKFGLYGAAINNLVVEILSLTIFNFFSKKVSIFRVQLILFDLKRVSISLKGMLKI